MKVGQETDMKQRTFLVTGASNGIGRAVCERLNRDGQTVIGLARHSDPTFPGELISVDLTDADATASVLTDIASRHRLCGVVNNVGIVETQPLEDVSLDKLRLVLDLNIRTAVQVTQAALPHMRNEQWGRIVNIASLVVLGGLERTSYAGAKAALIGMTRDWALELAAEGITANVVAPGSTDTKMFRSFAPPGSPEEAAYTNIIPVKRLGDPNELAAAICFFLSEEAGFITGQTLHVDGGESIGKASF